jgi:putative oxidoreductase
VQRFFSTFPNERPGAGLLLLRLMLAGGLLVDAMARLRDPTYAQIVTVAGEVGAGALLLIGLWTPVAGVIACLLQVGNLLMADATIELHVLRAAMGLCLVLLGPGAWSIDARLFGRKRVEIKHFRDD